MMSLKEVDSNQNLYKLTPYRGTLGTKSISFTKRIDWGVFLSFFPAVQNLAKA